MSSLKFLRIKLNLQLPRFRLSSSLHTLSLPPTSPPPQKKKKVKGPNPASIEIDVTLSLVSIFFKVGSSFGLLEAFFRLLFSMLLG